MEAQMETKAPDNKPTSRDVWMRGLFMLLFMIGFMFGVWVLNFLAIVQFVWLLVAREPNQFIARFGGSLSMWLAEIGRFLTCGTEDWPFPWRQWPDATSPSPRITSSGS
jgi:hypothetical protein